MSLLYLVACRGLLERAKELWLDVIGVNFHAGSGCNDPETYNQTMVDSRCVFDKMLKNSC